MFSFLVLSEPWRPSLTHTRRQSVLALRQQGPGACFSSSAIVSFSQSAWQAPNDWRNCVFFYLLKTCHSTASAVGTELPRLLFFSVYFSLSFCLFLSFFPLLPPPFFLSYKDPTTARYNSECLPALLQMASFFIFFAGLMSQSQHVGTNKSFWFMNLNRAVTLAIA